ncbi:cox cluster protein [Halobacteriales archaeon QS_3_64_16]|nr:MAG: cox cluster protein [Halobacteriales archaeon QS_3_64_16]
MVVVALYVLVVSITGLTGYLLGSIGPEGLRPVALFGLIELPPTPIGLALYGIVTLGVGLGIALGLVVFVSRRYA